MKKIFIGILAALIPLAVSAEPVKKELKDYFNTKQINEIKKYKKTFDNIKNDKDLASVYRRAVTLQEELTPPVNKIYQSNNQSLESIDVAMLRKNIPGMEPGQVAEGTELYFLLNYKDFSDPAKKTPEKADDKFINLMLTSYGEFETFFPEWFRQTWDYGGCSLLGSGKHIQALKLIEDNLKYDKLFEKEILEVKRKLLQDVLEWHIFCEPKTKVIKEIELIIKESIISSKEKVKLKERLKFLKGTKTPGIQFNCDKGNCNYGG